MMHPIESLVLRETALLDQGRLDDWLALYTEDATYWLPIDEHADPLKASSIIYDNHERLAMRVEQIMRQARVAQTPASHTMRMVSNLQVVEQDETTATACFCMQLTEVRSGDWRQRGLEGMRVYPGHGTLQARQVDGEWKIAAKKIVLLNRYQPIVGLSFII
ncbi:SnoaL-like domain-containing protein [Bordetella hinzii]|uniref:aromatic-ring-hydroxylating dioxygenase subunit beta n=1 Tax=Bordetella hinzii TaxID=103855 RepID=UPI0013EFF5BD|nr:aromatic-ring-hydroxylating dioxygenase subunit beta [Bordetella hinzii]QII86882.1 SnoaL-like domain-containing protein [Bordetella hinzii]